MTQIDGDDTFEDYASTERRRSEVILLRLLLVMPFVFLIAAVGFRWYVDSHPRDGDGAQPVQANSVDGTD